MVRHASAGDRPELINLLRAFHAAAGADYPFDPARAAALLAAHLQPCACVLVADAPTPRLADVGLAGVLMATAFDHPFGMGRTAKETFWFVRPEARGRTGLALLDAYEAWAREQGCTTVGMTTLASHDVSAIYRRRGYRPAETYFTKGL